MASNTSKTARASVRAGQSSGALSVLGEFKYLIPLDGGRHAYLRSPLTGRTNRLSTGSTAFVDEIRALSEAGHGLKISAELRALATASPADGWGATHQRLTEAAALGN